MVDDVVCNGRGANGTHCCIIRNQVCEFLVFEDTLPRCSLHDQWGDLHDNTEWADAPVGRWFAEKYPGFDCGDWPQDIPKVKAQAVTAGPFFECCWGRGNR